MKPIPDLRYVIVKARTYFSRAGHALVFYRHDRDSVPYIHHVETFYGQDGRATRSAAFRRGKAVCTRAETTGWRNPHITSGISLAAIRAKVPNIYEMCR